VIQGSRGQKFEQMAADHLHSEGWEILSRNFRDGPREIDLIVLRAGIVAFVEVKGRGSVDHGHPLEAITRRKRQDLSKAAAAWMRVHGTPRLYYRFDAIAITPEKKGGWAVQHLEDAWRRGE
jgi:putative endonuclease